MNYGNVKLAVITLAIAGGLSACDQPGPAEKAGKQMDQVANEAGKKISETVEKVDKSLSAQGSKTAQAIDDAEVTTRVKAAIFAESGLKSLKIDVDTVQGVVTLSGSVDSQASSDKAKMLASGVKGVKEVVNQLVVSTS